MRIYLATKYSSSSKLVRQHRHNNICFIAAKLIKMGHVVFSPISHYHNIADYMDNQNDGNFWMQHCRCFFDWAEALMVYDKKECETSKGVQAEIEAFRRQGKPICYIELKEEGCLAIEKELAPADIVNTKLKHFNCKCTDEN